MLLLPLSHEHAQMRRVPWVSIGILGICVAFQVHACAITPALERRGEAIEEEMASIEEQVIDEYAAHRAKKLHDRQPQPDLDDEQWVEKLAQGGSERAQNETLMGLKFDARSKLKAGELTKPGDPRVARYKQLDDELLALTRQVPAWRFGFRPAFDGFWRMLTSMSAHGGWLHLLGNMWFLYLVGCNLEDRWGRGQFALFYLVAGCIAALSFRALHRDSTIPLVGASGAVAGAMGAFMVCFTRTKIRMFYAYIIMIKPRWGTFEASAWAVLLVWAGEQLLMTFVEAHTSHTPVAHSAHAGGFLFGVAFALVLRKTGIDSQLDAASETAYERDGALWQENPLYVEAVTQRDLGSPAAGIEALIKLVEDDPKHVAGRELLLELGLAQRELRALDLSVPFAIDRHYRERQHDASVALYRELRRLLPEYGLTDQELLRVASAAGQTRDDSIVIASVSELIEQHRQSPLLPRALLLAAEAQARVGVLEQQRATLARIVQRFPDHACAVQARTQLGRLEARTS